MIVNFIKCFLFVPFLVVKIWNFTVIHYQRTTRSLSSGTCGQIRNLTLVTVSFICSWKLVEFTWCSLLINTIVFTSIVRYSKVIRVKRTAVRPNCAHASVSSQLCWKQCYNLRTALVHPRQQKPLLLSVSWITSRSECVLTNLWSSWLKYTARPHTHTGDHELFFPITVVNMSTAIDFSSTRNCVANHFPFVTLALSHCWQPP